MKKTFEAKTVKVNIINLDQQNPRFPPVKNQLEAIDTVLGDMGTKIVKLATHIYNNGINPSARPILFKEKGKLIDGDGNRRLTAIKIMETPALADNYPAIKKKINELLKKPGIIPSELDCVIYPNRKTANIWIAVNHRGEQEGIGQIRWNPEQSDRFDGKLSIGLQALDLLEHKNLISEEDKTKIYKSTLDRLLDYRHSKDTLNITKTNDKFIFNNIEHLRTIVLALRDVKVDAVYNAKKAKEFVQRALNAKTDHEAMSAEQEQLPSDISPAAPRTSRTRRVSKTPTALFGKALALHKGIINNLYRDLEELYDYYKSNNSTLSEHFMLIIRMALRLLIDIAAQDEGLDKLDAYLTKYCAQAMKKLKKKDKIILATQNVTEKDIKKLLHIGAHGYEAAQNEEQTLAISLIVGAMLTISHRK